MIIMYSNIFEASVTVSYIASAFEMYSDICVSLTESISDYYEFINEMMSLHDSS